jgi:hypothetical protein
MFLRRDNRPELSLIFFYCCIDLQIKYIMADDNNFLAATTTAASLPLPLPNQQSTILSRRDQNDQGGNVSADEEMVFSGSTETSFAANRTMTTTMTTTTSGMSQVATTSSEVLRLTLRPRSNVSWCVQTSSVFFVWN